MKKVLITILFAIALSCANTITKAPVGIDVSHHQGDINWKKVSSTNGLKYVYIKASEGSTYIDPKYKKNIKKAKEAGLLVGAYHFYSEKSSIEKQFNHFKSLYPKRSGNLLPMLDVEPRGKVSRKRMRSIRNDVMTFQRLCKEYYGQEAVLYIEPMLTENGWLGQLIQDDTKLCIGHPYTKAPMLANKRKYTIWQFTYSGRVSGITGGVDMHRLNKGVGLDDLKIK